MFESVSFQRIQRFAERVGFASLSIAIALSLGSHVAQAQSGQIVNVANGDVAGLISAIRLINVAGSGTINLAEGGTYGVSAPSDWWYGPNAFPAISSSVVINGNGSTISRVSGSPNFRFFYVSGGFTTLPAGSLYLDNLTLSGGLARGGGGGASGYDAGGGGGGAGMGGAIYNQGTTDLNLVTFLSNEAQGGDGGGFNCGGPCGGPGGGGGMGTSGGNFGTGVSPSGAGGGFKYSPSGEMGGGFQGSEGGMPITAGTSSFGGNGGSGGASGGGGGGYSLGQIGSSGSSIANGGVGALGAGQGGGQPGAGGCGSGGGGAFGGGGGMDSSASGACSGNYAGYGGGGGVGGGGAAGTYGAGSGGFGGGGAGTQSCLCDVNINNSTCAHGNGGFGGGGGACAQIYSTDQQPVGGWGGANASENPIGNQHGGGGAGLGGAIVNHGGQVTAADTTFTSNSAVAGGGGSGGEGSGGAIFNLNGSVTLANNTFTGNTSVNTDGSAGTGSSDYNLSHNGGETNSNQTPAATLNLVNTALSTANNALVNNQVNGAATVSTLAGAYIYVAQPSINLGSQNIGYYNPNSIVLNNIGSQALTLTSSNIQLSASFAFVSTTCNGITTGNSCQIFVTATSQAPGSFTGTLGITGAGVLNAPFSVAISAQSVIQSASMGSSTSPEKVLVTFSKAGQWVYQNAVSTGLTGLDYTIADLGNCVSGGNYHVGDTCYVDVVFSPQAIGSRNGAVWVDDENGNILATAYLPGIGLGPQLAYGITSLTTVATPTSSSLMIPTGVAIDANDDVFFADKGSNQVYEAVAGGYTTVNSIASGFNNPGQVAIDGEGNVFVADTGNNAIKEILRYPSPFYSTIVTVGSGFNKPEGVAVDGDGNVFVSDTGNSLIKEMPAASSYSRVVNIAQISGSPQGLAVDSNENVFVADTAFAIVREILAAGGYTTINSIGGAYLGAPKSVALDVAGNLYVSDPNQAAILEFTASSGYATASVLTSSPAGSLSYPQWVAVDGSGNFFFSDYGFPSNVIFKFNETNIPSFNFPTSTPVGSLDTADGARTAKLTNIGNESLEFFTPSSGSNPSYPANFPANTSDSNLCSSSVSLPAGSSCDVSANFMPSAAGVNTGSIVLTDNLMNATNATQTISAGGTGSGPSVSLSTTSLSFGSVPVGSTTASQTVTLTNTGGLTLTITSIAVTSANASSFAFANSCGSSLAAGANCTIHGHFSPTTSGALTAAITITDNAAGSPQSVALSGTGSTVAVSLSPTSLSFGSVNVGSTSASQTVTMTNTGSSTLAITSIAVTGTNASSFAFSNSCGSSLAAGANCTIHGHFSPTTTGALTAAITITDKATGSPQSVALTGTGSGPSVSLSATSLAFGNANVGSTTASQSVTMTNTGTKPLAISSIAITGANASSFTFANSCGSSLAAGANCAIHGHFAPAAIGAMTASITITDNATGSPQSIALSGTGVGPAVSLSATSLSFGNANVGSTTASQSVTMTNTGTKPLAISSIAITGANASSFTFANSCGSSRAAGANCSIHGHFNPTATGALTASITITDNATGSPQTITLSGIGQ